MAAFDISKVLGPNQAIGYAVTALNIFPGLGTVVAFVLGKLFADRGWQGNNPETQAHFMANVTTPIVTAAKNQDFSESTLQLALHNGYPYYEHFGGSATRWPQTAPAFYAIIIGNALSTGNWDRAMQFFSWLDRAVTNAREVAAANSGGPADPDAPEDIRAQQKMMRDRADGLYPEIEVAGQFWDASGLIGAIDSLNGFLSKVATGYGIPFTPTTSAVASVNQFRAALQAKIDNQANANAAMGTVNAAIVARYNAAGAAAQAAIRQQGAAAVAELQAAVKQKYENAIASAKSVIGGRLQFAVTAAGNKAKADLAKGVSQASAEAQYRKSLETAKAKATADLDAAVKSAAAAAQSALDAGTRQLPAEAERALREAAAAAKATAERDQQIAIRIRDYLSDPAGMVKALAPLNATYADIARVALVPVDQVTAILGPEGAKRAPGAPLLGTPEADAIIIRAYNATAGDPAALKREMNKFGLTAADVAAAVRLPVAQITAYLAPPAAPPAAIEAAPELGSPEADAIIVQAVKATMGNPAALKVEMAKFDLVAADIAAATGLPLSTVETYLAAA